VNGIPRGHVIPSRGLCQGDPPLPFVFLIYSEGLSGLLPIATARSSLQGFRLCSSAPIISHLLFADDTIIFCQANLSQAMLIKDILDTYAAASGQLVNYSKIDVSFSKGVPCVRQNAITIALDIREVLSHDKYLGLLTVIGRSRKKTFLFVIDRLKKRLSR